MLFRLHYRCLKCEQTWSEVDNDNHEGECIACGALAWPFRMQELEREPLYEIGVSRKPSVIAPRAYAEFEKVFGSLFGAPIRTEVPVRHAEPVNYSHQTDLFGGVS